VAKLAISQLEGDKKKLTSSFSLCLSFQTTTPVQEPRRPRLFQHPAQLLHDERHHHDRPSAVGGAIDTLFSRERFLSSQLVGGGRKSPAETLPVTVVDINKNMMFLFISTTVDKPM
jgi:hypothetical protein